MLTFLYVSGMMGSVHKDVTGRVTNRSAEAGLFAFGLAVLLLLMPGTDTSAQDLTSATFRVSTTFSDNNTRTVPVRISCSSGQATPQGGEASDEHPLELTVSSFVDGQLHCLVSLPAIDGYSLQYFAFDDAVGQSSGDPDGCEFVEFVSGDAGFCEVEISLEPSTVRVTREWVDPGRDIALTLYDEARYGCDSEAWGEYQGSLWFSGQSDTQTFEILADWEFGTVCSIWPVGRESSVAYDDEDCREVMIRPGSNAVCTIYNTRIFDADQPTWWYGWIVMAVFVLLIGFVASRILGKSAQDA